MATPTAEVEAKNKYTIEVRYESQDGTFKTAVSEREFNVPDKVGTVTVNVIGDNGKTGDPVERKFERIIAPTQEEFLALFESNPWFVMAAYHYGADLYARNVIKAPIATEVEGPGKAIAKLAEQIMASRQKLGRPIDKEKALELATQMAGLE